FTSDTVNVSGGDTIMGSSVNLQGSTVNGVAGTTGMTLSNSGTIKSTGGDISGTSAKGQDLTITGSGTGKFVSPDGKNINITATNNTSRHPNMILGPGNQEFDAGTGVSASQVNFNATSPSSSVTIQPTVTYDFPNDFSIVNINTGTFNGNPSQFDIHNPPNLN